MRGVMRYANLRRNWLLFEEFNINSANALDWPQCDGAIVAVGELARIRGFSSKFTHVVSCSGGANPDVVPVVSVDDIAVGRMAAEHLIGCRIKHLSYYGRASQPVTSRRVSGFQTVIQDRAAEFLQCPVEFDWTERLTQSSKRHWPPLIEWLKSVPRPTGIFCIDDMAAHDLAAACVEGGIHVPDQVAIIGVNNDDLLCESAWPPISSIRCDFQRVGYTAAELLDRLIRGETVPGEARCQRLPPIGVVVRSSTNLLAVEEPHIAESLRFIREHACDPCSVADVLRHVPVGRRWLERNFLELVGRTPYEEISYRRIQRAQQLLLTTDLNMVDIARECGFKGTRNFNYKFRELTGENPGAFRRSRTAP